MVAKLSNSLYLHRKDTWFKNKIMFTLKPVTHGSNSIFKLDKKNINPSLIFFWRLIQLRNNFQPLHCHSLAALDIIHHITHEFFLSKPNQCKPASERTSAPIFCFRRAYIKNVKRRLGLPIILINPHFYSSSIHQISFKSWAYSQLEPSSIVVPIHQVGFKSWTYS